jgi:ornithine cyclodeaminase
MKLITIPDLTKLIKVHGLNNFMLDLVNYLKQDFARFAEFNKTSRYAAHVPDGVIELMPIADNQYFSFKCVNGHPKNPAGGKQTVVATGQLAEITHGYPLLIAEMTILTALRTAATTIIATDYLARKDSAIMALIGTGAQSEFLVLAHQLIRPLTTIRYFDCDQHAMEKFARNLHNGGLKLIPCNSAAEACNAADIITVCTADKLQAQVLKNDWVKPGTHINGLGGDCPGKTELERLILLRSKVVVEYFAQSKIEGEIQQLNPAEIQQVVHAELWELVTQHKSGRSTLDEITLFDSVGFALEDYSALRLCYDLANKYNLGSSIEMVPQLTDPKDLISSLY